MSIQYYLKKNNLVDEHETYYARVVQGQNASFEEVIRYIAKGTTLTSLDIKSVIDGLNGAVIYFLEQGKHVNLPFANFSVGIHGTFNGKKDIFDEARHEVHPNVSAGKEIKAFFHKNGLSVEKVRAGSFDPEIHTFTDKTSGKVNSTATPGGMAEIDGYRLKFDTTDKEQGIYFVDAEGNEVKVSIIGRDKPQNCIFSIPESLQKGTYELIIKAPGYGDGELLTGRLKKPLTVK